MATVYVSQTATNGYAVGNDANTYAQAQSKATPKLTINSAIGACSAGDTIIVNDGTYAENYLGAGYLPSVGAFQKVLGGRYPVRQARTVI